MPKKGGWAGKALLWIVALGWAAVLFYFSGQNADESAGLSLRVTKYILRVFPSLPFAMDEIHFLVRKTAHFCIFALEGFLLGTAMMKTLPERWLGGVLAAVSCGVAAVLNEYHQTFSRGRSCEVRDMIIDSAGALTGVLAAALLLRILDRLSGRKRNVIIS